MSQLTGALLLMGNVTAVNEDSLSGTIFLSLNSVRLEVGLTMSCHGLSSGGLLHAYC